MAPEGGVQLSFQAANVAPATADVKEEKDRCMLMWYHSVVCDHLAPAVIDSWTRPIQPR